VSDSSPPIYPQLLNKDLEDQARRFMVPGERLVIVMRHHLAMIVIPIAIFVAGVFAAIGVDLFSAPGASKLRAGVWLIALGTFLYMSWYLLHWRNDYFIVTNKRLLHTNGLITKSVLTLPLGKVNDMTLERDLLGRLFGYGRFKAESAGKDPLGRNGLAFIARPEETYMEISNLLYGPGA
jgi:uncharacterized membrane protein YdbT with pleckstrin-like domain